MKFLVLSFLLLSVAAHARPDKVGNGGGLWMCYSPAGEIQGSVLVDFYEAQAEFDRKLLSPTKQDPMGIVDEIDLSLRERFPDYIAGWDRVLGLVKARFHLLPGELREIEDSLWRAKPLPMLCRTGWQYVQFGNYNDTLELVQVRKDLWESPLVSALDKAGLVWHETIYRWMREQFGDEDSVRARQVVGLLFSDMETTKARLKLSEILKQRSVDPQPGEPVFVCLMKNGVSWRYHLDYGTSELAARNQTLKTCQLSEGSHSYHCDQYTMRCDSFTSQKQKYTCAVSNGVSHLVYTETGRSPVEAEAKARRSCTDAGMPVHCDREATCN